MFFIPLYAYILSRHSNPPILAQSGLKGRLSGFQGGLGRALGFVPLFKKPAKKAGFSN